ncbi:unnamed protein product [Trichobilharzia szidati]|nr:unnamed protein product [Trichobilharzia szidati]
MDDALRELEEAATAQLLAVKTEDRRQAEAKILQFRSLAEPYELCTLILSRSTNDCLLYEAGRCLSHAVVREWNSIFASSWENTENCKALQLLTIILEWSQNRGFECGPAARQRILSAAGTLVKRASAANAEKIAAAWRLSKSDVTFPQKFRLSSRILTTPPDDPGPACWLMLKLIEYVEDLLQPLTQSDISAVNNDQDPVLKRGLLGLFILSALLDEFSYSEDSAQLNLPLEAHIFLRARFQDYELPRLFENLLCLANQLLLYWSSLDCSQLSNGQSEVVFRVINALDMITSWDFLPRELVGFHASRIRRTDHETRFRPSSKWHHVMGSDVFPRTLLLFVKLHTWVRGSDLLGSRTLSCLVRFSSMSGPLIDPISSSLTCLSSNGIMSSCFDQNNQTLCSSSTLHFLILIEHMNRWLNDGSTGSDNHQQEKDLTQTSIEQFINQAPVGLRDEIINRIVGVGLIIPSIKLENLIPYELPILSEFILNLVLNSSRAWEPVERVLSLPKLSSQEAVSKETCQSVFHMGLICLWIMNKFLAILSSLLKQCMRLMASSSTEIDGDGQLAHEAVERLFNCWSDLVDLIPSSLSDMSFVGGKQNNAVTECDSDDDSPLPLTTGQVQNADQLVQQMKKLLRMLRRSNSIRQSQLFQIYLASKLAQPVGLRRMIKNDDNNEEIDLELDEDDLTASEDSLFAVGACGLSSVEESVNTLVHLLNERVTQLMLHTQDRESEATVNLLEDAHWLLLITGHFLVSGPASLTSVLRTNCPWETQFSIPQQLLYLGSNATVDLVNSRRLILMSVVQTIDLKSNWPPENLSYTHVPSLVILLCSLFRLLWLQVMYSVGSAQLVADNFWLMTRVAVAYFCQHVVDRHTLNSNISRSPILSILQSDSTQPPAAHQGLLSNQENKQLSDGKENLSPENYCHDTNKACIQGLLMCARIALDMWSHEPQVLTALTRLLNVLSMHSPDASSTLACSAWYELCTIVCGPQASEQTWPNLPADSLIQLVEACLCGSWAIDKARLSSALSHNQTCEEMDTLLLQLLREIRQQVLRVVNILSADGVTFGSVQNAVAIDVLVNCTTVLRGVSRATGTVASSSESVTDLISLVWNGLLAPFLSSSASYLVLKCHNYSEAVQALFSLFADVADSCLIYLANLPSSSPLSSTSTDDPLSSSSSLLQGDKSMNGGNNGNGVVCVSSAFLNWIVILCKHYAKNTEGKLNFDATAEDDQIQELRLLLNLLNRVLYHEFELKLSGAIYVVVSGGGVNDKFLVQPNSDSAEEVTGNSVPTIDAAVIGLGHLLPLITESILAIPELCQAFYSLASYTCELRAQGFVGLTDHQLSCFGRLLRFGIFGENIIHSSRQVKPSSTTVGSSSSSGLSSSAPAGCVDNLVIQQCLEIVISFTDHFLEVRTRTQLCMTEELQAALRIISIIGLDTQFLSDLFNLLTRESYSVSLEAAFSSALLNLIHINPTAYSQLIHQWISECGNPVIQSRLSDAFEHLGGSCKTGEDEGQVDQSKSPDHILSNNNINNNNNANKYIACFTENKPTRSARSDFQQRFHLFVAEIRSFICFG